MDNNNRLLQQFFSSSNKNSYCRKTKSSNMKPFYSAVLKNLVTKYLTNKRTDGRSGLFHDQV